MRLGFWNRLAIVLAGLAIPLGSTWGVLKQWSDATDAEEAIYNLCMSPANQAMQRNDYAEYNKISQQCWSERFDTPHYRMGWVSWFQGMGIIAILCAIIYALIFGIVATVRWVWRGRSVNKNTETA